MRILVEQLAETPADFAFDADTAWWRSHVAPAKDLPSQLEEPLRVRFRGHSMGEDVLLEGRLEGELPLECSRCLARYRQRLHEPFRLLLEPAGSRTPADPEGAQALARDGMCLGEDVETGWYRGQTIDLAEFFHEIVMTALPVKPLCREECAGLCPRCGGDRNRVACDCPETSKHSPFAALEALRTGRREGD